jgi:hypothetical protein
MKDMVVDFGTDISGSWSAFSEASSFRSILTWSSSPFTTFSLKMSGSDSSFFSYPGSGS